MASTFKAQDRVQDRVIDIRVQDRDWAKSVSRPVSRPRMASRLPTPVDIITAWQSKIQFNNKIVKSYEFTKFWIRGIS